MRYEDASGTFQASGPIANDDSDTLTAGSRGPATGNVITGEGTQYGAAGADMAANAQVTALAGSGGEDTSFAAGKLSVAGEFGQLSMDAQGNYSYLANTGAPENVRDRFIYTLADNQGNSDTAALIVEIGKTPVVIKADAQQIVPGPDGVVTLPAGVELSDIMVVGRNLVVNLPDGTQLIIIDGAVFVPQLVLGGVEVPATNVAALLIGQEVQPAAGETPPSSGGNFALPPPPLDPGIPLGDLIPPTEYQYTPPEPQEVFDILDREPEAGAVAVQLDDDALSGGIAGGTGDDPDSVNATGFLPGSGGDGPLTWSLLLTGAPAGFTYVDGPGDSILVQQGGVTVLTITVNPATGEYSVVQNAPINHPAGDNENNVEFVIEYAVTDQDGDVAFGTLTVNVDDDTPTVDATVASDANVLLTTQDADTIGAATDTASSSADFGGIFGASGAFGADGPGTSSLVYSLSTTGGASGLTQGGVAINLYLIGGVVVGSTAANAGAVNASNTVFDISVNASGVVTVNQYSQIDHTNTDPSPTESPFDDHLISLPDGAVTLTLTASITDADGDTATDSASVPIGANIRFADDGPTAQVDGQAPLDTVVLDETRPEGTDTPDGDAPSGDASATIDFSDNFLAPDFGADGPGSVTYQLILSANGIGSGLYALEAGDTSDMDGDGYGQGVEITLSQSGNTITGSAGGVDYFTITIDPATGIVTFTQLNAIWHPTPGDFDEQVTLTTESLNDILVQQTVTDFDGDTDTASIGIGRGVFSIQDDGPDPYDPCPEDVITVNEPGSTFTGNLNLPDVGEDEPGTVTFGVQDGDPALDNSANQMTSGGTPLFYFINDQGVLEARAGDENGEVIFTITLNGDGTFTYEQFGTIDGAGGGELPFEDLTSTSAGNVEFRGVGADDAATEVDLLLSAGPGDGVTVNTDSDSIGAGNQSMDVNETVRIDLVTDLTTGAATPSGFGYTGHVSTSSFIGLIPQVQGNQDQTVAFTVWALDTNVAQGTEPDRDPAGGFSDSTITAITEVTVKDYLTGETTTLDVTGFVVGVFTPVAYGISVRVNADGSVTFAGIQEGDSYGFSTGSGDFNAVVVQSNAAGTGGSTQDSFDLGVFSIGIDDVPVEPVEFCVPVSLTDADGDSVVCEICVDLGAPLNVDDITVTVNEAGLPLIGSDAASDSEIDSGDLAPLVTGGTGPYTFAFAPGEDGNGAFGTLLLNPDGTFTYTLDTPFDSQPDADDGTNPELGVETFQVVVTDSLGAMQTLTIRVNIIDDVPTANDDVGNQANEGDPITVDVLANDVEGADGVDEDNNPAVKVELVGGTLTGTGILVYNNDGTFTYTPGAGEEGQITFDYRITDNDGDTSVATVTINLEDDSEPQIGTPENLEVDEDGFAFANLDEGQVNPTETDHGENLTDSGEVVVDFGNDVPGAPLVDSIELLDSGALDGQLVDLDGNPVTFALNGSGQLVGTANGIQVMIISISGAVAGPGAGEVTYTYSVQLLQPIQHADVGNTENSDLLSGVQFQVTDSDGDQATGSFNVTVWDDVPSAEDIEVNQPAEDANVVIDITSSITEGADGVDLSEVTHSAHTGSGNLSYDGNGVFTYDPAPGEEGDVTFTYTVVDGDGDEVTKMITIHLLADSSPTAGSSTALLDDDGLSGGNPASMTGDIDANVGEVAPTNSSEAIFHGLLNFNFGTDGAGSIDFAAMDGLNGTVGTETVVYDWDQATLTLTATTVGGTRPGTLLFTLELDDATSGEYTLTLNNNVLHAAGGNETSAPNVALTFTVEDGDGTTANGTLNITFNDDAPTINVTAGADAGVILTTDDADTIGVATDTAVSAANFGGVFGLSFAAGADGAATPTLSFTLDVTGYTGGPAGVDSGLNQGGNDIFLYEIGGKVVGSTSATLAGVNAGNTVFDVMVSATGVVTLTQYSQIDHPPGGDPTPTGSPFADHIISMADSLITLTASSTITDGDGDTASDSETVNIGANLRFTDDGPDANTSGAAVGTVTLDETRPEGSDTPGGSAPNGDASATIDFSVNFVTGGSVDYGADGPGSVTYALMLSGANVPSGLYALDPTDTNNGGDGDGYGQGGQIVLNQVGNVITGSFGGTDYFTITINPMTGVVTFAQINPIWHPTPGTASFDEAATLSTALASNIQVVQTVTDFDGDTDTASINIGQGVFIIQDDGPNAIEPDAASLTNAPGSMVTEDLDDDGEVLTDFGEDGAGLVRFANITNHQDSGLTSGDDAIRYYLSNNGQTLQAKINANPDGTGGTLIFTVQINQATGDYTVTMSGTIDNGAGVSFDDLTSSAAGNVNYRGVGENDPGTPVDLLLSATANNAIATVNTDSDSIGSANQSMDGDDGETVRIDFVSDLTTGAATPTGFGYSGHVDTNSYLQTIPQVQGAQSATVAFRVYALDTSDTQANAPDSNPAGGFANSSIVTITEVTVISFDNATPISLDISGIAVGVWTAVGYGISVQKQADGSVIFSGVQEGDQYGISTGATDFNAVAVTALAAGVGPVGNLSTQDSFDLGVFSIGSVDTGEPIDISFDLSITDADGDTIVMPGAIDITFEPEAQSLSLNSFVEQEEQLQKTAANSNTLTMAAAVAAAGMADSAAASPPADDQPFQVESEASVSTMVVEQVAANDDGDAGSSIAGLADSSAADEAAGNSGGHSRADEHRSDNSIDAAANRHASDEGSSQSANDQGSEASQAAAGQATAPAVAMASAEALAAAGLTGGSAKHGGAVEQILADALGHGNAPTVDGLLAHLPGGIGDLAALSNVASPAAGSVPGWDMAMHMGSGFTGDVLTKLDAAMLHHQDAAQPTVNG